MSDQLVQTRQQQCLFDTAQGACGLAWSDRGVTRMQLPERTRSRTASRLSIRAQARPSTEPPPEIGLVIRSLQRYFEGRSVDFARVTLDLHHVSDFHRAIYAAARELGWGQTATYGDLARRVGSPGAARAVGQAMGMNPVPIIVPCHRVLAAGGKIGGFSAYGGAVTKQRLLALEGVHLGGTPLLPGM